MRFQQLTFLVMILCLAFNPVFGQTSEIDGSLGETRAERPESDQEQGSTFTHGPRRIASPFQIQLMQTFTSATPFGVAPGAALHLGYQFSNHLYLGLTSSSFFEGRNLTDDHQNYPYDDDVIPVYGQEGAIKTESKLDPIHLVEVRLTPWDFGLYFSFGVMQRGKQTSTTEFKSESREIGEGTYVTGLEATLEYEEWLGTTTGVGFNYIFDSGLTLGSDLTLGLGQQSPEVSVSSTAVVSDSDLAYWKKQIEANERQVPFLISLSIGAAF